MKNISLPVALKSCALLFASCGKNGSSSNGQTTDTSVSPPISATCVAFSKNDSLKDIATKANMARVECGLNEEEIIKLITNS